jgi:hypothetical protein
MAILKPGQLASGSYTISGSFSGSFQGSGAGLNNIPSSAIVGLSSTQIASGAVSASVSTGTGSFTVTSGSSTFMFVSSSGNVGFGTTTPSRLLHVSEGGTRLSQTFNPGVPTLYVYHGRTETDSTVRFENASGDQLYFGGNGLFVTGNTTIGNGSTTLSARLGVKGSGTTSATTSFLVQNSTGTNAIQVLDDSKVYLGKAGNGGFSNEGDVVIGSPFYSSRLVFPASNSEGSGFTISVGFSSAIGDNSMVWYVPASGAYPMALKRSGQLSLNTITPNNSAQFQADSTTRGILITRTNLTSNISTPAQGLMTYVTASATEGLYYYNSGSAVGWHKVLTNSGSQDISGSLGVTGSISVTSGNIILNSNRIYLGNNATQMLYTSGADVYLENGATSRKIIFNNTSAGVFQFNNGNVLINTTTDAGFRLDVNGTARVSGQVDIVGLSSLQISAVQQSNSRVIQFNTNASSGGFNGGYDFRGGFNGSYGSSSVFRIYTASSGTSRVGIGNLTEPNMQSASAQLIIRSEITGGRNAGIRITPSTAATTQYNGIQFDYNTLDSGGGAFLGTQYNPLTNGYGVDLVVLTTNDTINNYSETARFIGKFNSFYVGTDKTLALASAKMQVESTTQGFLPPRMTQTQRNAIASPAIGLEIYQTDATEGKYIYKSSGWTYIG